MQIRSENHRSKFRRNSHMQTHRENCGSQGFFFTVVFPKTLWAYGLALGRGLWKSGETRDTFPGFLCGYGSCSGYLGCWCLVLGTSPTDALIPTRLQIDSCLAFVGSARVIISLMCFSDAGPGLRVVIRHRPINSCGP